MDQPALPGEDVQCNDAQLYLILLLLLQYLP